MADLDYRDRFFARYASCFQKLGPASNTRAHARWSRAYAKHLRGWLPQEKTALILDVACGSGRLLHLLRAAGYSRLHGVDISEEQVALARQVTPDVECSDAIEYLARHKETFDCITAIDIIEHLAKSELLAFLDACRESLRPGGRVVFQTPNGASPAASSVRYGDFSHEQCLTPDLLGVLTQLCGLVGYETREIGPTCQGVISAVRVATWKLLRAALMIWNLAETGSTARVLTRVFLASAVRPK